MPDAESFKFATFSFMTNFTSSISEVYLDKITAL